MPLTNHHNLLVKICKQKQTNIREMESQKFPETTLTEPQCQHFVTRKKRLCRMTVRPGRQYCGEHEPQPKTEEGKIDKRIPCPNDPKHTCYFSKLEKHLAICNARQGKLPPYVVQNINAPPAIEVCVRKPLSEIPRETIMQVINKVSNLYYKHIQENISTAPERPIHQSVLEEFNASDRAESSLRHLRQASSLLWLAEDEGLVQDRTCYVELGAGKGQMSYYLGQAWCEAQSRVLVVDRASLRHKRDNRLRGCSLRLRADLAHLALEQVSVIQESAAVVGIAKHLCGVATDYALRCITGAGVAAKCRGLVLATCCHHRCERAHYIANAQLKELGISGDELNVMLGIVSWATCGDGRSRKRRRQSADAAGDKDTSYVNNDETPGSGNRTSTRTSTKSNDIGSKDNELGTNSDVKGQEPLSQECREAAGRQAKALLDWGRVLHLRERGFDARLCHYVPQSISLENVCIVAKKHAET